MSDDLTWFSAFEICFGGFYDFTIADACQFFEYILQPLLLRDRPAETILRTQYQGRVKQGNGNPREQREEWTLVGDVFYASHSCSDTSVA